MECIQNEKSLKHRCKQTDLEIYCMLLKNLLLPNKSAGKSVKALIDILKTHLIPKPIEIGDP